MQNYPFTSKKDEVDCLSWVRKKAEAISDSLYSKGQLNIELFGEDSDLDEPDEALVYISKILDYSESRIAEISAASSKDWPDLDSEEWGVIWEKLRTLSNLTSDPIIDLEWRLDSKNTFHSATGRSRRPS